MNKLRKKSSQSLQIEKIGEKLRLANTEFDPNLILEKAKHEIDDHDGKTYKVTPQSSLFKAMTLLEFENGILLTTTVAVQYKTLCIDLSRKFQVEFNCKSAAEKSLCEIVAMNFIRCLEVQRKISNLFGQEGLTKLDVEFFTQLSKELDKAQRHYLSSLQTLRTFNQPSFQLSVRADTAVVGQNQVVQANNHENTD